MDSKDGNNKDAKSKIEQIRIDLERKLAAIEDSKTKIVDNQEELKDKLEENLSSKITQTGNETIEKIEEIEAKPVFEISEPIINVVDSEKEKNITKEAIKESIPKKIILEKTTTDNQEDNKIVAPPKTIIAAVENKPKGESNANDNNVDFQKEDEQEEEKKTKKGIFSFLIYALLIGLFAIIGYFYIDYNRESKSVEKEKMNQKLSEFKNKRYLDSIELADLNSQLEDLQSKKMLDSLDRVYEQELITNSKFANKKAIQRNFDLTSLKKEKLIDSNSKLSNTTTQEKNKKLENKSNSLPEAKGNTGDIVDSTNSSQEDDVSSQTKKEDKVLSQTIKEDKVDIATNSNEELKRDTNIAVPETPHKVSVKKRIVKSPVYPGCEKKKTELDRKKCFTSKMYKHISRKFNTSLAQNMGLKEGIHQVRVQYIIDKAGYATVLNVRAENKKLEQEAIRVIQSLPKMIPGTINGKRSKLQYNIPIKFAVNN